MLAPANEDNMLHWKTFERGNNWVCLQEGTSKLRVSWLGSAVSRTRTRRIRTTSLPRQPVENPAHPLPQHSFNPTAGSHLHVCLRVGERARSSGYREACKLFRTSLSYSHSLLWFIAGFSVWPDDKWLAPSTWNKTARRQCSEKEITRRSERHACPDLPSLQVLTHLILYQLTSAKYSVHQMQLVSRCEMTLFLLLWVHILQMFPTNQNASDAACFHSDISHNAPKLKTLITNMLRTNVSNSIFFQKNN